MEIRSFFLTKDVFDLEDLMIHSDLYVGGDSNQELLSVVKEQESKYVHDGLLEIEGSIVFSNHGFCIGDLPVFDDLPTLYAYYLNAIEDYIDSGTAQFYYPSQPIKVKMENVKQGCICLSIGSEKLVLIEVELMKKILILAEDFFETLVEELDLRKYKYEMDQIGKIKNLIDF